MKYFYIMVCVFFIMFFLTLIVVEGSCGDRVARLDSRLILHHKAKYFSEFYSENRLYWPHGPYTHQDFWAKTSYERKKQEFIALLNGPDGEQIARLFWSYTREKNRKKFYNGIWFRTQGSIPLVEKSALNILLKAF